MLLKCQRWLMCVFPTKPTQNVHYSLTWLIHKPHLNLYICSKTQDLQIYSLLYIVVCLFYFRYVYLNVDDGGEKSGTEWVRHGVLSLTTLDLNDPSHTSFAHPLLLPQDCVWFIGHRIQELFVLQIHRYITTTSLSYEKTMQSVESCLTDAC